MIAKGKKARRNARRHEKEFLCKRQASLNARLKADRILLAKIVQAAIDKGVFKELRDAIMKLSDLCGKHFGIGVKR